MNGMPAPRLLLMATGFIAVLAVGAAPMAGRTRVDAAEPVVLEIISFGSLHGDLTPCGCRIPRGGLPRRSQVVKSLQEAGTPYLHLDLGDFTKEDEASGTFVTNFIWQTYQKMDVAAVGVGPMELNAWTQFEGFMMSREIPVISSNVAIRTGGGTMPVGEPYRVFERAGLRIAVFCMMGSEEFSRVKHPDGAEFIFEDPVAKTRALLPRMKDHADIVVLMSQMSPAATDTLLAGVSGIDVALYGQWADWKPRAVSVGNTIVNQTGMKGEYLGRLALTVDGQGRIRSFQSMNAALDSTYPEDPVVGALTEEAEAEREALIREFRRKRQEEFEKRFLGG